MLKIGLTGGIGSGKSTVAGIFNVLGIPVFDADSEAKKIMEANNELICAIKHEFGEATYTAGKLNRAHLASLVFGNAYLLQKLNAIVHPATIAAAEAWMKRQSTAYIVKEAALLFEAGTTGGLNYVIGVYAPQHVRTHRVMNRDNLTHKQVLERMDRQINDEVKMRLCDFVITNDDQQMLIPQVVKLHAQFTSLAAKS